jgi:hypothetical protein
MGTLMKFVKLQDGHVGHIESLLRWIAQEVWSAGGDGDAIWISKYFSIEDILNIVNKMNETEWDNWWEILGNGEEICLSHGQESIIITNNQDFEVPSWSQCTIRW